MTILFAAGGTGGHIFPAISLAKEFQNLMPSANVVFVGTPVGMESTLVPKHGYQLEFIKIGGIKRKSIFSRIRSLFQIPGAFWSAYKILKKHSPSAVLGIGGYASGPVLLLSAWKGIYTGILEPNVIPGFSNRILSKWTKHVFLAFEEARNYFKEQNAIATGNPLREEILNVPAPNYESDKICVLIFGGSQGAHKINRSVTDALPKFFPYKDRLSFIHQTGTKDEDWVKREYAKFGLNAEVSAFISDMDKAFDKANLVVARSGSSVLEIAACGLPSILIPYPYAADQHQQANAQVMEKEGASIVIRDADFTGAYFSKTIESFLKDKSKLIKMSQAALNRRFENASKKL